jgi:hypothetical protein
MDHTVVASAIQQEPQSDGSAEADVGDDVAPVDRRLFPRLSARATRGLRMP